MTMREPREHESEMEAAFEDVFEHGVTDTVDEAALRRMRLVARLLDDAVRVPGTDFRVGVDPVLGLLPVAGDVVSGALSLYIVAEATRLGVSPVTLVRMLANVAVDVAGGSVPYVGTVFDAVWKANERNVKLVADDLGGR